MTTDGPLPEGTDDTGFAPSVCDTEDTLHEEEWTNRRGVKRCPGSQKGPVATGVWVAIVSRSLLGTPRAFRGPPWTVLQGAGDMQHFPGTLVAKVCGLSSRTGIARAQEPRQGRRGRDARSQASSCHPACGLGQATWPL